MTGTNRIGAATRLHRDRAFARTVPRRVVLLALTGLAVLSVVPLRGRALTYLAGGPTIAVLTAVLLSVALPQCAGPLLACRTWIDVTSPAQRPRVAT